MLKDVEGNEITVDDMAFNRHKKIIGSSGTGKTYFSVREIEEESKYGTVWVLDFSGSYSEEELRKNAFVPSCAVANWNPKQHPVCISGGMTDEDVTDHVTDAIITTFHINSMMQRRMINMACEAVLNKYRYISFRDLFLELGIMEKGADDMDEKKNMNFLLSRLYHLKNVGLFRVVSLKDGFQTGVHILQLSSFSERVCRTLAQFFLEIKWREIRHTPKRRQIVLDEFQLLQIKGTAIEEMLREGRKYGLGVTLLSQFAPKSEEIDIFEQAATSLYFAPNGHCLKDVARMIDPLQYKVWIPVLKQLRRGRCVLTGRYSINRGKHPADQPIICEVV